MKQENKPSERPLDLVVGATVRVVQTIDMGDGFTDAGEIREGMLGVVEDVDEVGGVVHVHLAECWGTSDDIPADTALLAFSVVEVVR